MVDVTVALVNDSSPLSLMAAMLAIATLRKLDCTLVVSRRLGRILFKQFYASSRYPERRPVAQRLQDVSSA